MPRAVKTLRKRSKPPASSDRTLADLATTNDPANVNATTEPKFITIKQAAAFSTMSDVSIRRFLTRKKLTRYKLGSRTLIRLSELLAMIHEA